MSSGKWCPFCLCLYVLSVDLERKYFVVIAYLSTCMFTICGRSSPSPSKTAKNKANAEERATPPKERTSPLKERNSPPKESLIQSPQAAITEVTIKDYEENWQKQVEVIMIYWCHFFFNPQPSWVWRVLQLLTLYPYYDFEYYHETSNIRRAVVGNKLADHSDVVGVSPVGAAPTTSSFST